MPARQTPKEREATRAKRVQQEADRIQATHKFLANSEDEEQTKAAASALIASLTPEQYEELLVTGTIWPVGSKSVVTDGVHRSEKDHPLALSNSQMYAFYKAKYMYHDHDHEGSAAMLTENEFTYDMTHHSEWHEDWEKGGDHNFLGLHMSKGEFSNIAAEFIAGSAWTAPEKAVAEGAVVLSKEMQVANDAVSAVKIGGKMWAPREGSLARLFGGAMSRGLASIFGIAQAGAEVAANTYVGAKFGFALNRLRAVIKAASRNSTAAINMLKGASKEAKGFTNLSAEEKAAMLEAGEITQEDITLFEALGKDIDWETGATEPFLASLNENIDAQETAMVNTARMRNRGTEDALAIKAGEKYGFSPTNEEEYKAMLKSNGQTMNPETAAEYDVWRLQENARRQRAVVAAEEAVKADTAAKEVAEANKDLPENWQTNTTHDGKRYWMEWSGGDGKDYPAWDLVTKQWTKPSKNIPLYSEYREGIKNPAFKKKYPNFGEWREEKFADIDLPKNWFSDIDATTGKRYWYEDGVEGTVTYTKPSEDHPTFEQWNALSAAEKAKNPDYLTWAEDVVLGAEEGEFMGGAQAAEPKAELTWKQRQDNLAKDGIVLPDEPKVRDIHNQMLNEEQSSLAAMGEVNLGDPGAEQYALGKETGGSRIGPSGKAYKYQGNAISDEDIQAYQFTSEAYVKPAKRARNMDGWIYDTKLSDEETAVYFNPTTNNLHVAHRGSTTFRDWYDSNAQIVFGLEGTRQGDRFEKSYNVVKLAYDKYQKLHPGADIALDMSGHSLGGAVSNYATGEMIKEGKTFNNVTTFNAAHTPLSNTRYSQELTAEQVKALETKVRSVRQSGDAVSVSGAPFGTRVTVNTTYQPVQAHSIKAFGNKRVENLTEWLVQDEETNKLVARNIPNRIQQYKAVAEAAITANPNITNEQLKAQMLGGSYKTLLNRPPQATIVVSLPNDGSSSTGEGGDTALTPDGTVTTDDPPAVSEVSGMSPAYTEPVFKIKQEVYYKNIDELFERTLNLCEDTYDDVEAFTEDNFGLYEDYLGDALRFPVLFEYRAQGDHLFVAFGGDEVGTSEAISVANGNKLIMYDNLRSTIRNPSTQIEFHAGFLEYLNVAYPVIRAEIDKYAGSVANLTVTGHGSGGGVAAIFYWIYENDSLHEDEKLPIRKCISYGSPRVYKNESNDPALFNDSCPNYVRCFTTEDAECYRPLHLKLVNNIDGLPSGFLHVGQSFCMDANYETQNVNLLIVKIYQQNSGALALLFRSYTLEQQANILNQILLTPMYQSLLIQCVLSLLGKMKIKDDVPVEAIPYICQEWMQELLGDGDTASYNAMLEKVKDIGLNPVFEEVNLESITNEETLLPSLMSLVMLTMLTIKRQETNGSVSAYRNYLDTLVNREISERLSFTAPIVVAKQTQLSQEQIVEEATRLMSLVPAIA